MFLSLFCNGQNNPIGVDASDIRLSVKVEEVKFIESVDFNVYRAETNGELGEIVFKEKTKSLFCSFSLYGENTGAKFFWTAEVTFDEGKILKETASFELGLNTLTTIGGWVDNPAFDGRVAEYVKTFNVAEKPEKARLYIVGLGMFESSINGKKTDDYYFKPLLTDFDERKDLTLNPHYKEENYKNDKKTVCYETFDVTDLLQVGENKLSVLLGTGWYCNTDKDYVDPSFTFGTPKLFFELHVKSQNQEWVIKSDLDMLVRNLQVKSQMFAGDFVDYSIAPEEYVAVGLAKAPKGKLVSHSSARDKVIEILQPESVKENKNVLLIDFGTNHTGGLSLRVKGKKGSKLKIKYYEVLNADGSPNPHTSRWIAYLNGEKPIGYIDQQGEYVLSGDEDVIRPLFHWNCYRYAEIIKDPDTEIIELNSLFISADMENDGTFVCAEAILNTLYKAFVVTQRDNMHCGVPSDCPHREKLPYTGDGQLAMESVMYCFNAEEFYRKWLKDIIDSQGNDGWVPYTAPFISGGGGYWWCNALNVVPLVLYKFTGDKSVLIEALEPSLKLIDFYLSMQDGDYVIKRSTATWVLGDWLSPDVVKSSQHFLSTFAFYSAVVNTMKNAEIIGRKDVVQKLQDLSVKIAKSINKIFFDKENLRYGNGEQGENVLPLAYGIVPEEYRKDLLDKVVKHYEETGCFDTGIVLTPVLLDFLTDNGYGALALKLMTRKEYPSFWYMIKEESTIPEHWSKYWSDKFDRETLTPTEKNADVSHCHPMFGSVVAWLFKSVAGLDLSKINERKIMFEPKLLKHVLDARAEKKTPYGMVKIKYDSHSYLKMAISIPNGLVGEVRIPCSDYETFFVTGKEQFKARRKGDYSYVRLSGGEWKISTNPLV